MHIRGGSHSFVIWKAQSRNKRKKSLISVITQTYKETRWGGGSATQGTFKLNCQWAHQPFGGTFDPICSVCAVCSPDQEGSVIMWLPPLKFSGHTGGHSSTNQFFHGWEGFNEEKGVEQVQFQLISEVKYIEPWWSDVIHQKEKCSLQQPTFQAESGLFFFFSLDFYN